MKRVNKVVEFALCTVLTIVGMGFYFIPIVHTGGSFHPDLFDPIFRAIQNEYYPVLYTSMILFIVSFGLGITQLFISNENRKFRICRIVFYSATVLFYVLTIILAFTYHSMYR